MDGPEPPNPPSEDLTCLEMARLLYPIHRSPSFVFWRSGGPWSETHVVTVVRTGPDSGQLKMQHVGPGGMRP